VICDRFLDSSLAYQGGAGGVGLEAVRALHAIGSGGFLPDRTLLLELPQHDGSERASQRDGGAADRIGARSAQYHEDVAASFRSIAMLEPERFRIVDASGPPEEVTERLLGALPDLL
jgi:dTMP kinase